MRQRDKETERQIDREIEKKTKKVDRDVESDIEISFYLSFSRIIEPIQTGTRSIQLPGSGWLSGPQCPCVCM